MVSCTWINVRCWWICGGIDSCRVRCAIGKMTRNGRALFDSECQTGSLIIFTSAKNNRFVLMFKMMNEFDFKNLETMLNRILKRNFENHWIFTRFGRNVCQNFKFFFSYQVSFLFLSNNVMNDESNDPKTFSWCFYVTWTPWCHWCCLLSLQTKVKSQFCRICYSKSYFKINQEYTYNQYHWLFIIILFLPS